MLIDILLMFYYIYDVNIACTLFKEVITHLKYNREVCIGSIRALKLIFTWETSKIFIVLKKKD